METSKAVSRKSVVFLSTCFVLLMICTIFIWGFQSQWGAVKIERHRIIGADGSSVSTLVYIPKNATVETPAPVVVINHGRSNQGHSNDTWSLELARRGYVVLSPDLSGGGESDVTDRDQQAIGVARYAKEMSITDANSLNIVGYSAGIGTSFSVARNMPGEVHSVLGVFGPFMASLSGEASGLDVHYGIIKAIADQYDYEFLGGPDECRDATAVSFGMESIEPGVDYNYQEKLLRYIEVDGALHQTGNISGQTITEIIDFVETVAPAPLQRNINDQVWLWQQIFSGIACVTMLFFLAALISLLLEMPFFQNVRNAVPEKAPRKGRKAWGIDVLFSFVIPAVLFIPVSAYGMAWFSNSKIFTSTNLNGIMVWLIAVAAIGLLRTVLGLKKRRKQGEEISLGDYALGAAGQKKINWAVPAKSLLIGIICATVVFVWLSAIEGFAGINYQVWNLSTYLKMSPGRFVRAAPYVLVIFTVMFLGNINQRVLPSTGNERRDLYIAVAVNTFFTASALLFLLVLQYGGSLMIGTGQPVFNQMVLPGVSGGTSVGALDFSFGYCYMMGGTTGIVTYIYRKYGNIWAGVVPCAIFAGFVTTTGFTLVG